VDQLQVWAEGFVSTPWIFLVVYLFAVVDGFFPPIPSESLVIAIAALWAATGQPNLAGIVVVAAAGAFTGDQITYQVGRLVKVRRLRLFRGDRGRAVLDWAEQTLERRGTSFVIAARFIPVGRVAVNAIAGALRFRRLRFMAADGAASALWAVYLMAVGLVAGKTFGDHPVVAVMVGVAGGFVIGFLVDRALRRFTTVGPPDVRSDPGVVTPRPQDVDPDASARC
jgi:membrane protein DedA with SNARE-associated domain